MTLALLLCVCSGRADRPNTTQTQSPFHSPGDIDRGSSGDTLLLGVFRLNKDYMLESMGEPLRELLRACFLCFTVQNIHLESSTFA